MKKSTYKWMLTRRELYTLLYVTMAVCIMSVYALLLLLPAAYPGPSPSEQFHLRPLDVGTRHRPADRRYCYRFRAYQFYICTYPPGADEVVSATLAGGDLWEARAVDAMLGWLRRDPTLALIDVGANLGVYSLAAAAAGADVLAVEPLPAHLSLLRASLSLSHLEPRVTVLPYAVSGQRANVTLATDTANRGATRVVSAGGAARGLCVNSASTACAAAAAVTLDDLLLLPGGFSRFNHSVLKVDIEGHEVETLQAGRRFWEEVSVPVILMEWGLIPDQVRSRRLSRRQMLDFVEFMERLGYRARGWDGGGGNRLATSGFMDWGMDIIWAKDSFSLGLDQPESNAAS